MLIWLIIGCEIGFWLFLFLGLFVRYVLKLEKFSKLLLFCVPLLDVILLIATAIDLNNGTPAEFAHGLAAIYLGFTVVYGHSIINWMDQYISYKFLSGEKPHNHINYGWSYTWYEWKQWLKGVAACAIAAFLLLVAIVYIDQPHQTESLKEWFGHMFWVLIIWLICWPLWYTLFPKKKV